MIGGLTENKISLWFLGVEEKSYILVYFIFNSIKLEFRAGFAA